MKAMAHRVSHPADVVYQHVISGLWCMVSRREAETGMHTAHRVSRPPRADATGGPLHTVSDTAKMPPVPVLVMRCLSQSDPAHHARCASSQVDHAWEMQPGGKLLPVTWPPQHG
jgi:hypothetical protein